MILKYIRLKPTIYFFLKETEPSDTIREKLCDSEKPLICFSSIRDEMVMTEKRFLIADRKGVSGKKIKFISIPYSSITLYTVGMVGGLDLDAEILLNLRGNVKIQLRFLRSRQIMHSIHKAYEIITSYFICNT
ncbi:MAG TPA: PH domain-containing protein [Clostridiaceae bacterium]|nr:PH domain-containing protein [Clostridiaceae bacterium]